MVQLATIAPEFVGLEYLGLDPEILLANLARIKHRGDWCPSELSLLTSLELQIAAEEELPGITLERSCNYVFYWALVDLENYLSAVDIVLELCFCGS